MDLVVDRTRQINHLEGQLLEIFAALELSSAMADRVPVVSDSGAGLTCSAVETVLSIKKRCRGSSVRVPAQRQEAHLTTGPAPPLREATAPVPGSAENRRS
ncbi:hypothetical protein OG568_01790 [Streptomyces sp. NBC_01450]|uniref:hypothetical protein n=1 Tax=Streptomyces sp. NBC_01450 TaxID=2903871 RepID=UPI002E3506D2|nr:hypothetical protein [Streptomyces sp. NBC_01450]